MVPRRRNPVVGALTLLSCCSLCPTLSFLPSTPHAPLHAGRAARSSERGGLTTTATTFVNPVATQNHQRHQQRRARTRSGLANGDHQQQKGVALGSFLRASTSNRRNGDRSKLHMMMMAAVAAAADDGTSSGGGDASASAAASDALAGSSSGTAATPVAPPPQLNNDDDDDDDDELPLTLDQALEEGVNRAMRGDTGVLRQVLAPGVRWQGPLGNNAGLAKVEEELRGLGSLLSEPRMSVFASKDGASKLEWIASGTWPLPWLPRFIVKGKSTVETGADGKVRVVSG